MRNVKADDIETFTDKEKDLLRTAMEGYFQWEQELAIKGEVKLDHDLEFD